MAKRKRKEFFEYQYGPKSFLRLGDRFRVKGGPEYITEHKENIPVYDRGVFVFRRYCEQGACKWIEATWDGTSTSVRLWVGRVMRSPAVPGLRRRPYRITRKIKPGEPASRGKKHPGSRAAGRARGATRNVV